MKFNNYKKEVEESSSNELEDFVEYEENIEDDGYYDEETDTYYSREDLEREKRYLDRVQARNDFKARMKNPFGIGDKINDIDDKIKYGSSKTKLFFILGTLAALTILVVIFTMVF